MELRNRRQAKWQKDKYTKKKEQYECDVNKRISIEVASGVHT